VIKVSDFIMKHLTELGVEQVFMITGGGAMHLNDSVGKYLRYICNHHEQASAIAAEGFARVSGKLAVVIVTTGPGSTNTLTGVFGQWTDSVPVLYISGQVKYETSIQSCRGIKLRQLGDQEVNIIDIVKPITKFAVSVADPMDVKRLLAKAIHFATSGRPGPVWLDIPMNVQGAMVDETKMVDYHAEEDEEFFNKDEVQLKVAQILDLLQKTHRPVLVAGHGIRISGARELFFKLAEDLGIPILTTFNGFDLIPTNHPLLIGKIGTIGDRAGNFALQNADIAIFIGSRNNIRQISYNWKSCARGAKKIVIDIDSAELEKPTIKPDIPVHSDAGYFIQELMIQMKHKKFPEWDEWLKWCSERRKRYPVVLPHYKSEEELVNPYYFIQALTEALPENMTVVTANGTASVAYFQAGIVKRGQRILWNSGCAAMGYDLPAAIGACLGSGKKKIVCIAGDGSIQMNIQELATAVYHKLPLCIFVLNNEGYISIKQTQANFFGQLVGCDCSSGIGFPDIIKIAEAYGLRTEKISSYKDMNEKIHKVLSSSVPILCEVMLTPHYTFSPKLSSEKKRDGKIVSKPLEDMYPFLEREEFQSNMLIPEWVEEQDTNKPDTEKNKNAL
jgi:acetolactate synthase I/II/III large subunit